MDLDLARSLVKQLESALSDSPPVPPTVIINTPDQLDAALGSAVAGSTLTLANSLVYQAPLTLRTPITLQGETWASRIGVRMTADEPAPRFLNGIKTVGDHISLAGIEAAQTNPTVDIVVLSGGWPIMDRCRILGDAVKGAKRGIAANGSDMTITRCYVDDCFGPYPGDDCQAVCAWNMGPGLLIEDCFLRGGHETVMIGGGDASSADRMPSHITIRWNVITKRPEWQTMAIGVKNTLELKAARDVLIEDNDISYSWGGHGQDGYLFLCTVRNQDGRAPWSTVQNVVFRNNRLSHGAAAINILGLDNIKETKDNRPTPIGTVRPSVRASDISITGNSFTDLDPTKWAGSNKMIQVGSGPVNVTIDQNLFDGLHIGSQVYFYGSPACAGMVITNNTWPKSTYGIKGDGQASGANTWVTYVTGGTLSGNVEK
jgi:hypothetical protein